uniref:Putative ovule protein n=1 Tax=Solanum chacoense TaxID=4108 RepID=A0A0V0GSX7_SOLCH
MSDAARRSLKSRGLTFPPWRKHRFMQNKWFSSYKRTTNIIPTANSPAWLSPSKETNAVKMPDRRVSHYRREQLPVVSRDNSY